MQGELNNRIIACGRCPRLVAWRERVAREKKREFRDWEYWGKPIPSFGNLSAHVLIIGLAPAAHGANRTGRMFTGDSSGRWLYRALHKAGFANQPASERRDDGLRLIDCYITAAIHCAPPGNKPLPSEIANCNQFLREELDALRNLKVVITLGRIAFETYLKTRGIAPLPSFAHNRRCDFNPVLIASYHPSRQNTNTGKLTELMFDAVFAQAKAVL
ncbi:MAG: uracil-DNA glycosylase [Verrucomicrobia bacterium]|nr:uracil-DNA glycosylase [Verrucomicrobiota bacterium]